MSDQTYAELWAMLFGEQPYERYGAPEPELLAELIPVLPEAALEEAVWGVAGIGLLWETQRMRVLAALLERVAEAGQETLLAQAIIQFPDAMQYLPESLLPQALAAVRTVEWWDESAQATALAVLTARAPEPSLQDVLAAARSPISYGDRARASALRESMVRLPGPLSEETVSELLSAVRAIEQDLNRAQALTGLLGHLDEPLRSEVIEEILAAFQSDVSWTPERAAALAELSLQVSEPLRSQVLRQALGEVREQGSETERARALVEIAQRVGEPLQSELRQEIHSLDIPDLDLIPLAPYLSEAQLERALETVPTEPGLLEGALADLAPYLPERLLTRAVTMDWPEESQAQVLMALAPYLPPQLLREAVEVALTFEGRWWRGRALAALLPHLSADARAMIEAETALVSGERIRRLWTQLSEDEQVSLAQETIYATCDYYGGGAPPESPVDRGELEAVEADDSGGWMDADLSEEWEELEPEEEWAEEEAEPWVEEPLSPEWKGVEPQSLPPEERLVNTGFSSPSEAGSPLGSTTPLAPGQAYYFWLQVSRRVVGAIDVKPTALPVEQLPPEARLTVALFAFEDEIEIVPGADVGEIQIQPNGSVRVVRPVAQPDTLRDGDPLQRDQCLFFPVSTPWETGTYRLRCNIYYQQVLVQSHLVRVQVAKSTEWPFLDAGEAALQTECDYTLSNTLRAEHLAHLQPHRLSIMLNDNGDGTHGFRFYGADNAETERPADTGRPGEFKQDASFTGLELQDLIEIARGAMRQAAWGDTAPWQGGKNYRYGGPFDSSRLEQLRADLVNLAKRGYRFYDATINRLAAGMASDRREIRRQVHELKRLMRRSGGLIQIASKESVQHIVPLAVFYDYGLDDTARAEGYTLCPEFVKALKAGDALVESACFRGDCPSQDEETVICPSGFWGYRHNIGMPVSIGGSLADAAVEIRYQDAPQLTVAVSTDPDFKMRADHERALRSLSGGAGWHYADTRDQALDLMQSVPSHLVYFYCHGGLTQDSLPYIQVGPPGERGITSGLMRSKDIFWDEPQPLVFINGCHTTALEPEVAFNLVQSFVETTGAAGVIGTEITIFEPLAVAFAEECLGHFLHGVPIGEAVRRARLRLLQEGNPLGLVYDAFVVASLSMVRAS